jgi:hypothetical protein
MTDKIKDRVKKLLALGSNNPNENEANRAMELAQKLMIEHGLSVDMLSPEAPRMTMGDGRYPGKDAWTDFVAQACCALYGCRLIKYPDGGLSFSGREDNSDAAGQTFQYLCDQIEKLYKLSLPSGMSQPERAQYRKSFKRAAASRVYYRASELVENLKARGTDGKNALVVVSHIEQLTDEVDQFLKSAKLKTRETRAVSLGSDHEALRAGRRAGDLVNLQTSIS